MSTEKTTIQEVDLRDIVKLLVRNWYVFLLLGVIFVVAGLLVSLRTPSKYSTQSTLLIKTTDGMNALSMGLAQIPGANAFLGGNKVIGDEIEVFRSNAFMTMVVNDLGLQTEVYYRKRLGGWYDVHGREPLAIVCPEQFLSSIKGSLTVKVKKVGDAEWKMRFKHKFNNKTTKEKHTVTTLDSPVHTQWGDFAFVEMAENIDEKYPDYSVEYSIVSVSSRVEQYRKDISIDATSKTSNVILLNAKGSNPEKNEKIINKIVDIYNADAVKDKSDASRRTLELLDRRLVLLADELDTIERKVESYRRDNNLADMSEQSRIAIEAANEYNHAITGLEIKLNTLSFIEEFIEGASLTDLIPSNASTGDETLASLIVSYNNQVIEYLRLSRSTNEDNPVIKQLQTRISLNRENIKKTVNNVKANLEMQKDEIDARNKDLQGKINNIPTIEREFIDIARMQSLKRGLYVYLLQRKEEAEMAVNAANAENKIIDRAYTSPTRVAPRIKLTLVISIFFSGLLSILVIYMKSLFRKGEDAKGR